MGTNYYLRKPEGDICTHCGRGESYEELHIGKSSAGWKFCFDHEGNRFNSFSEWKQIISKFPDKIYNEYGQKIKPEDLYEKIKSKQSCLSHYAKEEGSASQNEYEVDGYRFLKSTGFS